MKDMKTMKYHNTKPSDIHQPLANPMLFNLTLCARHCWYVDSNHSGPTMRCTAIAQPMTRLLNSLFMPFMLFMVDRFDGHRYSYLSRSLSVLSSLHRIGYLNSVAF